MAKSASSAKALPGLIVRWRLPAGLIVGGPSCWRASARPGSGHPEPAAVHEYQSGWTRLELSVGARADPTVPRPSVESRLGLSGFQGSAAKFLNPRPPGDHGPGEALSLRRAGWWPWSPAHWSQIKGLPEGTRQLTASSSNYSRAHIATTWEAIRSFFQGVRLF